MIGAVCGNRYHFEGHSSSGSALHISDGKTAWDLHPEAHAYTYEPAPAKGYKPPAPYLMDEAEAQRAVDFLRISPAWPLAIWGRHDCQTRVSR